MKYQDEYMTTEELAKALRVHVRTIMRIIERKQLKAVRVGRNWRMRREWVEEWLQRQTVNLGQTHTVRGKHSGQ